LKEAASLGGDISKLVPEHVELALKEKFKTPYQEVSDKPIESSI
jgi:hypothetical protein